MRVVGAGRNDVAASRRGNCRTNSLPARYNSRVRPGISVYRERPLWRSGRLLMSGDGAGQSPFSTK
jgi:hypothetical protein